MFFHHLCAQRNPHHGGDGPHGVVGQPHRDAEPLSHIRNGGEVHVAVIGRVLAAALEQDNLVISLPPACVYRVLNFLHTAHSAADHHGLSLGGGILNQRNVHQLKAGDLVRLTADSLQKIDGCPVKGRREEIHPAGLAFLLDSLLPLPGRARIPVQIVELITVPKSAFDSKIFIVAVDGHGIRRIGLDFHAVRAGFGRLTHNRQGILQLPGVIGAHLRDDIDLIRRQLVP